MQIFRLIVHYGSIAALAATSLGHADKPTMKAVVIHEYGGPEVLKYEDVPQPEPKQDQLRIRVIAAGVKPVDGMIRSGMFEQEEHRVSPVMKVGQTVHIHGGSCCVGIFAIQIAKAHGAKVIATASAANQELLKQLGADVAIDYTKQNFENVAKDVDVVLDSIGKDTLARSYGVVKNGGIIVSLVARPDPAELEKHGIRGEALSVDPNSDELSEIGKLIDEKKINVIVSQTF